MSLVKKYESMTMNKKLNRTASIVIASLSIYACSGNATNAASSSGLSDNIMESIYCALPDTACLAGDRAQMLAGGKTVAKDGSFDHAAYPDGVACVADSIITAYADENADGGWSARMWNTSEPDVKVVLVVQEHGTATDFAYCYRYNVTTKSVTKAPDVLKMPDVGDFLYPGSMRDWAIDEYRQEAMRTATPWGNSCMTFDIYSPMLTITFYSPAIDTDNLFDIDSRQIPIRFRWTGNRFEQYPGRHFYCYWLYDQPDGAEPISLRFSSDDDGNPAMLTIGSLATEYWVSGKVACVNGNTYSFDGKCTSDGSEMQCRGSFTAYVDNDSEMLHIKFDFDLPGVFDADKQYVLTCN